MTDLWRRLRGETRPILLYGMGNGAEKILSEAKNRAFSVSGVFCSDGFVRGKTFHGMPVTDLAAAEEAFGDFVILLAFGSGREEVLETICRTAKRHPLFVPDLPVAGEEIFDADFLSLHANELEKAKTILEDDLSKELFDAVVCAKVTGELPYFFLHTSTGAEQAALFHPETYENCLDLGAYDGDTAKSLLALAPQIRLITALEPDPKTFARLVKKTQGLPVFPVNAAAWDKNETLFFSATGGRGASAAEDGRAESSIPVQGIAPDFLPESVGTDYVKIDVEGAERKALEGLRRTIARDRPEMRVAVYHRAEDLFALPLWIHENFPFYELRLRRKRSLPAWDLDLLCVPKP